MRSFIKAIVFTGVITSTLPFNAVGQKDLIKEKLELREANVAILAECVRHGHVLPKTGRQPDVMEAKMATLRKILLVDDDDDLREALSEQLVMTEDFDVFEARNGAEGMEKVKQGQYDLVILDVGLPDTDGRELCKRMRKAAVKCPIMMLTGHDSATRRAKLADFGIARIESSNLTQAGTIMGTPSYMSPEQLSGQPIDGRSDLYSLGVALFQLLTGELPYRNDSMAQLMRAIAQEEVPSVCQIRPGLPPALGDVVAVALQKHASMRYSDGHQMADDLRAVLYMVAAAQNVDLDVA